MDPGEEDPDMAYMLGEVGLRELGAQRHLSVWAHREDDVFVGGRMSQASGVVGSQKLQEFLGITGHGETRQLAWPLLGRVQEGVTVGRRSLSLVTCLRC